MQGADIEYDLHHPDFSTSDRDDAILDVYVLQPEALSAEVRKHIEAEIADDPALRAFVDELRAFYEELEDETELPEPVRVFIRKLTGE